MKEEEMNDEQWAEYIAKKQKEDGDKLYEKIKKSALEAGKEPFDAEKMDKLWTSRYRSSMDADEIIKEQLEHEKDYYLDEDVMTIEEFVGYKKMLDRYI